VLFALFAGVFRYVDQHFHNPETFFENNSDLAVNADIRQHLFDGFRDEIISIADGDIEEEENQASGLPDLFDDDEAEEDIDPVTQARTDRDQAIEKILGEVFDSPAYFDTFNNALVQVQTSTIRAAELEPAALLRDSGDIVFDMRALYNLEINPRLAAEPLTTEIPQNVYPDDAGIFKVADRSTTIDMAWTMIQKGPGWRTFTWFMAILSFVLAVALADRRPSTIIQFGGGVVGLAVVAVVVVYLIRFIVPVLAGGSGSASAVVATYASNTAPLVSAMLRLGAIGAVLAIVGGIAKFIWPDDWVYSSVSGEGGVRSIRRRRGTPVEPEPQPQQRRAPVAAAVPVAGYPGYPQQQPPGYPQQWVQPYPGQYPPGYPAPYPVGPYAQPQSAQPQSQHYTGPGPGRPTVPVTPVTVDDSGDDGALIPPAAPPADRTPGTPANLPDDAAQVVPRVVAMTDTTLDASRAKATVVETGDASTNGESVATSSDNGAADDIITPDNVALDNGTVVSDPADADDTWASENDW